MENAPVQGALIIGGVRIKRLSTIKRKPDRIKAGDMGMRVMVD